MGMRYPQSDIRNPKDMCLIDVSRDVIVENKRGTTSLTTLNGISL